MSTPIVELIAEQIQTLINAVTTTNGFNQDLVAVRPKRIHLEGDINDDNTVIIEQESAAVLSQSNEKIIWRQGFAIQAIVIDSDTAAAGIDTRLNQVRSDIEKKLMTGTNWKLGGLADGLLFRATEKFISDPQLAGIAVNIDVIYTVDADDPYAQS